MVPGEYSTLHINVKSVLLPKPGCPAALWSNPKQHPCQRDTLDRELTKVQAGLTAGCPGLTSTLGQTLLCMWNQNLGVSSRHPLRLQIPASFPSQDRILLHFFPSWTQTVVSLCLPGTRVALKIGPTSKQYK